MMDSVLEYNETPRCQKCYRHSPADDDRRLMEEMVQRPSVHKFIPMDHEVPRVPIFLGVVSLITVRLISVWPVLLD